MISFDTNVLVYATATATASDERVSRARDLLARAMQATNAVFLLQSLAEFSSVAVRKAGIPVENVARIVKAWCAVLPIQSADESDLVLALDAVRSHRLAFWDAMLWASAQRAGVRQILTEDFQDGFALGDVTFINPFKPENDPLIDTLFSHS
jgi:predicted nucleic acid-binding protein